MDRRLALLAALLVASCAERPPPRSAIQHDAIAKSDLEGEWYFRQTVIGVPFTAGFTFIGEQGENEMEKIRWDIQESVLTARRTYEYVRGSEEGEPSHAGAPYQGAPVAAFKIESHFDIVREYNTSTGEEYDKLVENTERRWFEREFIRVDWSQNLITNFDFLADFDHGGVGSIRQDPAPYYVSDPADPDSLRLERPAPDQPATYLEVTQKLVASPQTVDFEDFANVPLCWLEYSTSDCASQEIRLRNSFLRVTPRGYEPLAYGDLDMERFGYFTTERKGYNRQYGMTESGRIRLINRFDLWQHSLSDATCRADTDCGPATPGVRCVKELPDAAVSADGTVTGRCSLPYAARTLEDPKNPGSRDLGPRKIVYYVNDSFPAELKDIARQIGEELDATFRGMARAATGREPGPVFVMCTNNPVQPGDSPDCGQAGTHARIGDLRYNLLYWVDEPQSAQLLGYGPSSHDPETGETISATAFVYGAMVDEYAAMARDIVRLVNGDLAPDRFISGVDVRRWVAERSAGVRARTYTQEQVDAMASAMDLSWTSSLPRTPSVRKGSPRALREMVRTRSAALARSPVLGADVGLTSRRLAALQGTDLERRLVNGEILLARGMDPRLSPVAVDPAKVRPLSLVNPEVSRAVKRERRRLSAKGVDLAASFDDSVIGLALQQKGVDPTDVWRRLRREIFRAVALHELGHTLGLRHNFAGSYDPLNYPKTYWDLRTAGGHVPGPRYLDPLRQVELEGVISPSGLRGGIEEFMYSSIMDYGSGFAADLQGLGRYDRAALKFGYGGLVEVFNGVRDAYLLGALQATVTYGEPQPLLVDCAGNDWISLHYTKLPALADLDNRSDVAASSVRRSVLRPDCAYPDEVEHDDRNRLVVPYKFCSDEFEGASPGCASYDRGADMYEVASTAIDQYRSYYLFHNFKRDRLGFSPEGYLDMLYSRYLDPLRGQMQFYVLYRSDFADAIPDDGTPGNFWRSPDGWGPFTVAVTEGFNLLGDILRAPEPGPYFLYQLEDGREAYLMDPWEESTPDFVVDVPQGRYFSTEWELDAGYYWYERVRHIGSFLDKVAALAELTDPETYFLGKDLAADTREYSINYYRLFSSQVTHVFAGMLTDRWDRFAPVWTGSEFRRRPISEPITIPGPGEGYPVDPNVGFSVQLYGATFGVALISAGFDQTFSDSARVWLQGHGQQIDSTLPKVTFSDPSSGKIYVAISYKAGVIETGIAARMIARANELAQLAPSDPYAEAALESYVELLEVMRSLSSVYADPVY